MTGPKRVTEKQLIANRANALRSTGPQSAQGRAAVRYNALKHGILAQAVIPEALEPYESRAARCPVTMARLRNEPIVPLLGTPSAHCGQRRSASTVSPNIEESPP
jgi:hypothetical protein